MSTVSSVGTEQANRLSKRYSIGIDSGGGLGQDSAGVHAGLFEQILSLPVPIESYAAGDDYSSTLAPGSQQDFDSAESSATSEQQVDESDADESSTEDSTDAAASVLVVDQSIPVVANNEPTPKTLEAEQQSGHEETAPPPEDADEQAASAIDEASQQTVAPVAAQDNRDQSQDQESAETTVVVDKAVVEQLPGQSGEASLNAELASTNPDGEETRQDTPEVQLSDLQDDAAERARQSEAESNNEQVGVEAKDTEQVADARPGDDRRDSRDRREKWFERDAGAQAPNDADIVPSQSREDAAQEREQVGAAQAVTSDAAPPQPEIELTTFEETLVANAEIPQAVSASATASLDGLPTLPSANDSPTEDTSARAVEGVARGSERRATNSAAANSQTPGDSVDLTQQERVRLVQRVARSFARLGPEGGQINLRLHPPQLGSLNVQVRLEGRSMTANLTTESSAARDVIMESLPVLRSRLAEQGFEISSFQVDVATNGSDASQGGNSEPNHDPNNGERDSFVNYRPSRAGNRPNEGPPPPRISQDNLMWQTTTGIDVHA